MMVAAVLASACWFTNDNFNDCYIYSVNGTVHYTEVPDIAQAVYYNGAPASVPLTVRVKIGERTSSMTSIVSTSLSYRISRNAQWISQWQVVKSYSNLPAGVDFALPVTIFGTNSINPKSWKYNGYTYTLAANDRIYLMYYVTDGVYASCNMSLLSSMPPSMLDTQETESTYRYITYGITPPFITYITYNGKRKVTY